MSEHVSDFDRHGDVESVLGCVLCGEPRLPGSAYCPSCIRDVCPRCGFVHTYRSACDPPSTGDCPPYVG